MPLVYQGRMPNVGGSDPLTTLRAGEALFEQTSTHRRVDVRLAWDNPTPLALCAERLPTDFAGYWIDLAARADAGRLDEYLRLATTLRGGRLALSCLARRRDFEVAVTLPGPGPDRVDAERLDPLRRQRHVERLVVSASETGERAAFDAARLRHAAARAAAAYGDLTASLSDLPDFAAWLLDEQQVPPVDPRHLAEPQARRATWWTGPRPAAPMLPAAEVQLRPALLDAAPIGVSVALPTGAQSSALAIWCKWLGLLDTIDLITVRCRGTYAEIESLLHALDLHLRHPNQPYHTFGLTTVDEPEPPAAEQLDALLALPALNEPLLDWDVRWSDLALRLDQTTAGPAPLAGSFGFVRTEANRRFDRLQLVLALDDPRSAAFRFARRQLAARFGPTVDRASMWQFEGAPLDSAMGRNYAALTDALWPTIEAGRAIDGPRAARSGPSLAGVVGSVGRLLRRPRAEVDLMALFTEALAERLPGFSHDRQAHVTDRYFIEFVRRTRGGQHALRVERLHDPPGFRLEVGVAAMPIPLSDLDVAADRAAPGIVLPLHALVPDGQPLEWHFRGVREAAAAVDDAVALLAARAGPFFEAAESQLLAFHDASPSGVPP
ncbi:MAG: hypothetical protein KC620_04500 [Myxococcales bacterium]|nr:hypothetical protein [Myxococcales bacterium]